MIIIISKIVFILSLLGVLFIIFRKLPELSKLPGESSAGQFSFKSILSWPLVIIRQFTSSNFFQSVIVGNLEKSLRKFKIRALKINNILDKFLRKLKKGSDL